MTTVQRVAQIFGLMFIVVAVAGFVTSGGSMDADMETAPRIFGLFPVNLLHNLAHLLFGIWGVLAARSWGGARAYCQIAGVAYLGLAVLGFFTPETLGLMPIGGNDIWLHALLGIALAAIGFTAKRPATPVVTTTV